MASVTKLMAALLFTHSITCVWKWFPSLKILFLDWRDGLTYRIVISTSFDPSFHVKARSGSRQACKPSCEGGREGSQACCLPAWLKNSSSKFTEMCPRNKAWWRGTRRQEVLSLRPACPHGLRRTARTVTGALPGSAFLQDESNVTNSINKRRQLTNAEIIFILKYSSVSRNYLCGGFRK